MSDSEHYRNAVTRIEDRMHPKLEPMGVGVGIETVIKETVDDLANILSEAKADALRVVNRAIERRGGSRGRDETPADAAAVYAIAEILAGLHRG